MANRRLALAAGLLLVPPALLAQGPPPAPDPMIVEYVHLDALGNIRAVTNQAGQVIERHDYLPFGEECLSGPCATNPNAGAGQPRKFTGKERDTETSFDYFGARYYQAKWGRFTTVDPAINIKANLTEPQRWNRYAYVTNNPLRFTDPDGRDKVAEFFLGGAGKNINTFEALFGGEARAHYAQVAKAHPFLAGQLAVASIVTPGPEDLALAGALKFAPQGAKLLSAFTKSTIDDVLASSARAVGQTTEGARALQKKLGHAESGGYRSAFEGIEPTQQNAEGLVHNILSNPSRTVVGNKTIDAYNAAGQGVRIEAATSKFVGFLEQALATR